MNVFRVKVMVDGQWHSTYIPQFDTGAECSAFCKRLNAIHTRFNTNRRYAVGKFDSNIDPEMLALCDAISKDDMRRPSFWNEPWCRAVRYRDAPEVTRECGYPRIVYGAHRMSTAYYDYVIQRGGSNYERFYRADELKGADISFEVLTSAEDIVKAYEDGPSSCMSGAVDDCDAEFRTGDIHPCSVYGDSDLALAVMRVNGVVACRTIVWPEKMRYMRIYGNYSDQFANMLHEHGYKKSDNYFYGARIHRVETEHGIICPYLDCGNSVDVEGEWLVIADCGEYCATNTSGLICLVDMCANCGESPGETYVDGALWCRYCTDDCAVYCEDCHEYTHVDNSTSVCTGYVCSSCAENYTECENCNEYVPNDDIEYVEDTPICDHCLDKVSSFCNECDERMFDDHLSDDGLCKSCEEAAEREREDEQTEETQTTFEFVDETRRAAVG